MSNIIQLTCEAIIAFSDIDSAAEVCISESLRLFKDKFIMYILALLFLYYHRQSITAETNVTFNFSEFKRMSH